MTAHTAPSYGVAAPHAATDAAGRPVDVSFVVPTMRREAFLPALVARLFGQTGCGPVSLQVVIVDNCPHESAREIVAGLRLRYGPALRYLTEKRPGVSHVRNTGVAAAAGSLIGFVDDDELPDEGWLAHMLACKRRHGAAIVFGPVYPRFDSVRAAHDPFLRRAFTQDSSRPTGALVEPRSLFRAMFRPSSCFRTMATNNALVERDQFSSEQAAFDPALGHLGGEDLLFFHNLYLAGRKCVWCREAVVFERVAETRSELSYVLKRRFRDGQITSFCCLLSTPRQFSRLILSMSVGLLQFAAGCGLSLLLTAVGSRRARATVSVAAAGIGKLLWMRRYHWRSYGLSGGAGGT